MAPKLISKKFLVIRFSLALMSAMALASCSNKTLKDTDKALDDMGKDRQITKDIQLTPTQNDKIRVQF